MTQKDDTSASTIFPLPRFRHHKRQQRPILTSQRRRRRRGRSEGQAIVASALTAAFAFVVFILVTIADESVQRPDQPPNAVDDPVHVHGIGVNPADGALLIATHTGLFRTPAGRTSPHRVTDSRQDTMGFSIVGPDWFIGSGHPDLREMRTKDLPPHLGLIESRDGGKTWVSVSLLGEADLHVLRAKGNRIYGFDATKGRLLVSADRGRTWTEQPLPEAQPVIDLAVHPEDPRRVVAATPAGLYELRRDGRWSSRSAMSGLLAWPADDRLYVITGGGDVHVSSDRGATWRRAGAVAEEPAAFHADDPDDLYVALHDGTIKTSSDGGSSWFDRSVPSAAT